MLSGRVVHLERDGRIVIEVEGGGLSNFDAHNLGGASTPVMQPGDVVAGQLFSLGSRTILHLPTGRIVRGRIDRTDAKGSAVAISKAS